MNRQAIVTAAFLVSLPLAAQIPGEQWERIAVLATSTQAVALAPNYLSGTSNVTAFAGTKGLGVWRTTDGGANWQQSTFDPVLANAVVTDLVVSPNFITDQTVFAITLDKGVFRSTNGAGATVAFTRVMAPPTTKSTGTSLAISPKYNGTTPFDTIVFAGFDGAGLYYTQDAGASWTYDPNTPMSGILDLAISPQFGSAGNRDLFVGGRGYVVAGTINALWLRQGFPTGTWLARDSGLGTAPSETVSSLLALLDPGGSGNAWLFAGTETHGHWRSTNAGSSWTAGCDGTTTGTLPRVNALARSGGSSATLLEGRSDDLFSSTNEGATCTATGPALSIQALAFEPQWNGVTYCDQYIATASGLYRRSCAARLGRGPDKADGYRMALADNGNGRFMASLSQGLYKCVSRGATKGGEMVRYNNFPNKMVPEVTDVVLTPAYLDSGGFPATIDQGLLFVAANFPESPTDNGVYRSIDYGNTWTRLSSGWPVPAVQDPPILVNDLAISPSYLDGGTDQTIFAATTHGLYRWSGSTWNFAWLTGDYREIDSVGLPPTYQYASAYPFPHNPNELVMVGTHSGNTYQVWFSGNSGTTWTLTGYPGTTWGKVRAFAFESKFGSSSTSALVAVASTRIENSDHFEGPFAPDGYSVQDNAGTGKFWGRNDSFGAPNRTVSVGGTGFSAAADSLAGGSGSTWDTELVSPKIDLIGAAAPYLTYLSNFTIATGSISKIWLDISQDGGVTWTNLRYANTSAGATVESQSLAAYAGSVIMLRFHYNCPAGSMSYWHIDNLRVGRDGGTSDVREGGIFMSSSLIGSVLWATWTDVDKGLGEFPSAWDVAMEPQYTPGSKEDLVSATDNGVYFSTNAALNWTRATAVTTAPPPSPAAFSVAYDKAEPTGKVVVAGFQAAGASYSDLGGQSFATAFTGYHYLPSDVWASVVHERDTDIIFSASPSMGIFVSENQGVSFRPWNRGFGGGPPFMRTGLGINMLANRRGANLDAVWAGSVEDGIKVRNIYYDTSTGKVDLDTEDGTTQNGWRHNTWWSTGSTITGRFERIEVMPGTGTSYPAWATGETGPAGSAQGMAQLPGTWWNTWKQQNTGLPGVPESKGVDFGYGSADPEALADGVPSGGFVAQGNWTYYSIYVPAGSTDLKVYLQDLGTDSDLFLRYGALPTDTTYDYHPGLVGVDEQVCLGNKTWLSEDFDAGTPVGWSITPTSGNRWQRNDTYPVANRCTYGTGYSMAVESPKYSGWSTEMNSPAVDLTHAGSASLTFASNYKSTSSSLARLMLSTDGGSTWEKTLPYQSADTLESLDLSSYLGQPLLLRWHYNRLSSDSGIGWWHVDNIDVSGTTLAKGTWYIGVKGVGSGNNAYQLTASLNTSCTPTGPAAMAASRGGTPGGNAAGRTSQPRVGHAASPRRTVSPLTTDHRSFAPGPMVPAATISWGTVNLTGGGGGVFRGVDSGGTVTWTARNGSGGGTLANLHANTVRQLPDLTLVAGCDPDAANGSLFYSPAPDAGQTTWVNATPNVASAGSNDFRDLLVAQNGDLLVAANGTGTGSSAGGVWLSGDKGRHWMRLSQGFDAANQNLTDLVDDNGSTPSYYASTESTGVYTRTITASPYPTMTLLNPAFGPADGGTSITLSGSDFADICPTGTASDCPNSSPVVIVDGVEQSSVFVDSGTLTFVTNPHPAGFVEIKVRNPDTRSSGTGLLFHYLCEPPTGAAAPTPVDPDPYSFSGVQITWPQDPATWGDGEGNTGTYGVLRDASPLASGLPYGTINFQDTSGAGGTSYLYSIVYTNGCSQATESPQVSQLDDAEAAAQSGTALKFLDATNLDWGSTSGADGYKLYRGTSTELGNLPVGAASCAVYQGANTAAVDATVPSPGDFFWYVVTATKGGGEGNAGPGRVVTDLGSCP